MRGFAEVVGLMAPTRCSSAGPSRHSRLYAHEPAAQAQWSQQGARSASKFPPAVGQGALRDSRGQSGYGAAGDPAGLGYVLCGVASTVGDAVFQGLRILSLFPGSVAERAGLRQGDQVLIANGVRLVTLMDFVTARSVHDDRLELTVRRGNDIIETVLRFERPDMPIPDPNVPSA